MNKCAEFMGNFAKVFVGSRQRPRQKPGCLKTWEFSTFLCNSSIPISRFCYLNDCSKRLIAYFANTSNCTTRYLGAFRAPNFSKALTSGFFYHSSLSPWDRHKGDHHYVLVHLLGGSYDDHQKRLYILLICAFRVPKCQIFYTEQIFQAKSYPKKRP